MELSLTTPAVLFPAISLLLLAYTNRFLAISTLIRNLKKRFDEEGTEHIIGQIRNLRRRIFLIRNMQWLGVFALFLCVISMFLIFENQPIVVVNFGSATSNEIKKFTDKIKKIVQEKTGLTLEDEVIIF